MNDMKEIFKEWNKVNNKIQKKKVPYEKLLNDIRIIENNILYEVEKQPIFQYKNELYNLVLAILRRYTKAGDNNLSEAKKQIDSLQQCLLKNNFIEEKDLYMLHGYLNAKMEDISMIYREDDRKLMKVYNNFFKYGGRG